MLKKIALLLLLSLSLIGCKPTQRQQLPGGLNVEEYLVEKTLPDRIYDKYKNERGAFFKGAINDRVNSAEFSLNDSITIVSEKINDEKWLIGVSRDGNQVYETEVANLSGVSGLVQAWNYDAHWALEIIPYPFTLESKADVIVDGDSLKEVKDYKEVFGFQLLAGKPFFFFRNENGVGISYNGQDSEALYDDVLYRNYWIGYDPDPVQYENMVEFTAEREKKQYLVFIGFFQE